MLACAHVLAMDAKNLLDVVDSIRVRYPDLVLPAHLQPQPQSLTSPITSTPGSNINASHSSTSITTSVVASTTMNNSFLPSHQSVTQTKVATLTTYTTPNENQYQNSPLDCYQNVGPAAIRLQHTASPPSSLTHSYNDTNAGSSAVNIPTSTGLQQQQQIYSNQSGIYDNEAVISQQIKSLELGNNNNSSNNTAPPKKEVIKPPPPIRSSGLVSKMRANFQQQAAAASSEVTNGRTNGAVKDPLSEPLKIIEDDLYTNTAGGLQLPEPVSCTIVSENLIATNQAKAVSK